MGSRPKSWFGGITIGVAAMFAAAAHAQTGDVARESKADAEIALARYADCLAGRPVFRKRIESFLRTLPDSSAASLAAENIALPGHRPVPDACLMRQMEGEKGIVALRFQPRDLREALYPALYRRDFGQNGPPAGLADTPPLSVANEFDGDATELSPAYRARRLLGECVSRLDPDATHAMVMALPHSPDAMTALNSLKPVIGRCLPVGETFRLGQASIRAFLGEALYKLALAKVEEKPSPTP